MDFWFGSEHSYNQYAEALRAAREKYGCEGAIQLEIAKLSEDDDYDPNPVGLQVIGKVGVITTNGPTVTNSSWWSRFIGTPSYEDIKSRFIQLANDFEVKVVVHCIDTPGGAAKGVSQLSDFIRAYSDRVKNVISYNTGSVASAGLWYGTAGTHLISSKEGETGSVGAIIVHTEYTEMLKIEGIHKTVFRSAPFKALGSPFEKLDQRARDDIQERLMRSHNSFVSGLSGNLGLSESYVQENIASGKLFGAEEARQLKLVHGIKTFEQLVASLNKKFDNPSRL